MAKTDLERISVVETKLDEVCDKLTKHIEKQDLFESKIESRMEDLGFILKVFRYLGWAISIAVSAAIVWLVEGILRK